VLEVNITGNCGQYIKNCLQLLTEDVRQYYRPLVPYCKRRMEGMGIGIYFAGNVNVSNVSPQFYAFEGETLATRCLNLL